jgi:hypothetical protein
VLNFEELGSKASPSFIEYKHPLSTPIQDGGFARLTTSRFFNRSVFVSTRFGCLLARCVLCEKKNTHLEGLFDHVAS